MSVSQTGLGSLYLCAVLLGFALGAVYDALRITRVFLGVHYSRRTARALRRISLPMLAPIKDRGESRALGLVVFLEDFCFCLLAAILLILLFYEMNDGKPRLLTVVICAGGFLIYRATLGRLVILFSEVIAFVLEVAVRYLLFVLLFPIQRVGQCLVKGARGATSRVKEKRQKKERVRYTAAEQARIKRNACGMIPQGNARKALKKGKKYARKSRKKAIQSEYASPSGNSFDRGDIDRCFCKQRDEV